MKIQKFYGFTALSVYYPTENVWQSDFCEPYEWNTEEEMRLDMLIHHIADDEQEKMQFSLWNCQDEHEFLDRYNAHMYWLNNSEPDYDPTL